MFNIIYYLLQILMLINNYISIVFFTSTFCNFISKMVLLDNFLDYKVILDTLSQVYPYIPIKYQINKMFRCYELFVNQDMLIP